MYCNVFNKYRKFEKKLKYHTFFNKISLSIVYSKFGYEHKKIFKEIWKYKIMSKET